LKKNANITNNPPQKDKTFGREETSLDRVSNEVLPKVVYISVNPKSKSPEEKAPSIKYFEPASVLNSDSR
jgi:NADPH-dependent curcumin reductase CurA